MKNSTVFQQMYLCISKGLPASRRRHVAQHSLTHCEHFECKQVGGNQLCCNFSRLKKFFRAPLAPKLSILCKCHSMGWGLEGVGGGGGGLVSASQAAPPPRGRGANALKGVHNSFNG